MMNSEVNFNNRTKKGFNKKIIEGVVISDKMDKTIVVRVTKFHPHKKYKKIVQHNTKFYVHDEKNSCLVGDVVYIYETRPISKKKFYHLYSKKVKL